MKIYAEFNFQACSYGELGIACAIFTNVYWHYEVEVDNCFYTVSVVYSIIMDLEGTNKTINIENTFAILGGKITQPFLSLNK